VKYTDGDFIKLVRIDKNVKFFWHIDVFLPFQCKTRKNAMVEYLDYQIPVTQLKGPKGNGDMQAVKRD